MRGAYTMNELGVVLLLCMVNMLPVVTVYTPCRQQWQECHP